jgi:hypothetical protein
MKTLIAVISFQGDAENGNHDNIRQTWGKDVASAGADLRFFIGRRDKVYAPKADEILIPWQEDGTRTCAHPYWHAEPGCTCVEYWQVLYRGILDWSIRNGYDYTYLAENDTFLIPRKLMKIGFENYDFSGWMMYLKADQPDHFYVEPGAGYFLSKRAAEIVLRPAPDHRHFDALVCDTLRPLAERGEATIKHLDHFWNEVAWHYRAQKIETPVIGHGYPAGSRWQHDMYQKHGANQ